MARGTEAAQRGWEALRLCSQCGATKHPSEFYTQRSLGNPSKAGSDGLKRECRECSIERARRYGKANPEKVRANNRLQGAKKRANKTRWQDQPENREAHLADRRRIYAESGGREKQRAYIAGLTAEQREARARNRASFSSGMRRGGAIAEDWEYALMLRHDPCCYCGGRAGTIDHVVPVSLGGTSRWTNLTAACRRCNTSKHNKGLLLWLTRN